MWEQAEITLEARPRGVHLVTGEVLDGIGDRLGGFAAGLCQLFILHTSASLAVNENASSDVRHDTRTWLDTVVPEQFPWTHTLEGSDDMPAHVKSMITGSSLLLPVREGRLALGTWQGIYLLEHRDHGGSREIVLTAWGEPA